jgi:hypothetical protein
MRDDSFGRWDEPPEGVLSKLAEYGSSAADLSVIDAISTGVTQAAVTRVAVRAALRMLLANHLITAESSWSWPEYVTFAAPGEDR